MSTIDLRNVKTPEEAKRLMHEGLRPAVEVRIRWGHLDRMPTCRHGRVFCTDCGVIA